MKLKIPVEIEMEQKMSDRAKKFNKEYWVLEVQLRFLFFDEIRKNNFDEFEKFKEKILDDLTFLKDKINNIKKNKISGGINVYFSSFDVIKKISKKYSSKYFCEVKHSKKIMGKDNLKSKDLYRHYLLINIINLNKNDLVKIKGIDYKINSIDKKVLYLRELENGRKAKFSYNLIKDYLVKL